MRYVVNIYRKGSPDFDISPWHVANGTNTVRCELRSTALLVMEKHIAHPDIMTIVVRSICSGDGTTLDVIYWQWIRIRDGLKLPDLK